MTADGALFLYFHYLLPWHSVAGEDECVAALGDRLDALSVSERLGRGRGRGRAAGAGAGPERRPGSLATTDLPDPLDLVSSRRELAGRGKGRGKRAAEELADWPPLPKVYYRKHGRRQVRVRGESG